LVLQGCRKALKVAIFEQIRRGNYRKIFFVACLAARPRAPVPYWLALLPVTAMGTTETIMVQTNTATDRFIHVENIILFRKRLTETIKPAQRLQLLRLLGEEEGKKQLPPKEK
jgi:hypothetical protein